LSGQEVDGRERFYEGAHNMISELVLMLGRARAILQREGLIQLIERGFDYARRRLFLYGHYYIYEHTPEERNEADFMPRIQDFSFRIVRSNEEADELAAAIGCDFRRRFITTRKSLDKGAIAFCVFVDGEIAHIGLIAFSEEAKNTFDFIPYEVDFANNEVCTGGTETVDKYRGNGLMVYGYFKRFQFLREIGITTSRNAVNVNNIASQRAHARFGPKVYARIRYLKVLGWEFSKETPLLPTATNG
jgi:RimJ/RimL family protein N-acetyltransferase